MVLGCRGKGKGMEIPYNGSVTFFNNDVSLGNNTEISAHAYDISFLEGTFDGVIIQILLLAYPLSCSKEVHRVLKNDGIVYAETSFNQQIHMGAYDYRRLSHLGYRRVFRLFSEIESGIASGPGMILA